eukprot:4628020-Pyramimonas_sp.AAC.1
MLRAPAGFGPPFPASRRPAAAWASFTTAGGSLPRCADTGVGTLQLSSAWQYRTSVLQPSAAFQRAVLQLCPQQLSTAA